VLAGGDLQGALLSKTLLAVQSLSGAVLDESQLAYLTSFGDDVKDALTQIRAGCRPPRDASGTD